MSNVLDVSDMNAPTLFAVTIALALSWVSPAAAEQIRIVSWNLANLAEGPGIDLRGYTRSREDFDQLLFVISKLQPDIVALQELGSAPAAEAILRGEKPLAPRST